MSKIKQRPWLEESSEKGFFQLSNELLEFAVSFREEIDFKCGERLNHEAILSRGWSVGLMLETSEDDIFHVRAAMDFLSNTGKALAIPAGSIHKEDDFINDFDPPLVAEFKPSLENYIRIRSGLIQMISGKFYVFNEGVSLVILHNNGKYSMMAGPKMEIEKILHSTVERSWESVLKDGQIAPTLREDLYSAMRSYGLA